MQIHRDDQIINIDARPSDSIAIALRFSAPIFAQDSLLTALVFEDASSEEGELYSSPGANPESASTDEMSAEQLKRYLENLRPEDFGKFNI
jgi:bifunctional DNase/RNase